MRKRVFNFQFSIFKKQFAYGYSRNAIYCSWLSYILIWSCSERREEAIPVTADFNIEVINNDFSVPVEVRIINTTEGADTYNWNFEGASPSESSSRNPSTITYNEAGDYAITLDASNQDGSLDTKTVTVPIDAEINIGFIADIVTDNFPPMEVVLTNTTVGADTYVWTFQGGNPSSSTSQAPENVVFNAPGNYTITLEVGNGIETYQTEQTVTVAPHLVADFSYDVAFVDDDLQVPVTVTITNNSVSATTYNWTFIGGTPSTSTEAIPTVVYNTPGTYELVLEASNGKETQMVSQFITVVPDTNIRVFEDIQLGINTAHTANQVGAFFSTTTREVYTQDQVNEEIGAAIDIAFFGLNENFTFNRFITPTEVQNQVFDAIPNAVHTKFINLQEACGCAASLSVSEFDSITDDTLLSALPIIETVGGVQDFDDTVQPRIVLFETADGRKGAIKVKTFVNDGPNSYIIVDVKVQKQ